MSIASPEIKANCYELHNLPLYCAFVLIWGLKITSRDDDMEEVHREVWYTKDKLKGRSYLCYFLVHSFFVVPSSTLVCKFFDWVLLHREWVLLFLSLGWTHICQALVQHSGTAMAPWEQWDLDDTMGFDQEPDLSYHLIYIKYQSINTHPNWAMSSSLPCYQDD